LNFFAQTLSYLHVPQDGQHSGAAEFLGELVARSVEMKSKLISPAVIHRKFLTVFRLLTSSTVILGVTLSVAHAAEGDNVASKRIVKDRETQRAIFGKGAEIANRAKPDGSGTGDAIAPDAAARGIEKKDIRRGMVIAKPSSLNSRDTHQAPGECPPCGTLPRTPKQVPHD
jgi:translation elongation factor EF-Tu-like GTPase